MYDSIDRLAQKSDDPVIKKLLQIAGMAAIVECADLPENAKKTFYATFSEIYKALADEMPDFVKGENIQWKQYLKNMIRCPDNEEKIEDLLGDIKTPTKEKSNYGSLFKQLAEYYAQKAGLSYEGKTK